MAIFIENKKFVYGWKNNFFNPIKYQLCLLSEKVHSSGMNDIGYLILKF